MPSPYGSARPLSVVTRSAPAMNSETRRVLPIPGSPKTVTRLARRSRTVRESAFSSSSSSCSRPMNQAAATPRGASSDRIARHVQSGSARPLISTGPASSTSTDPAASRRTTGPSTISPGPADCWRRAAMLTASPVANVDEAVSSTTTSPASTPIRASRPSAAHLLHHGERRAQRALGVVLVRARDAERGHHRVAGELLDRAPVQLDARRGLVEVLAHAAPDDLGIDGADELGRVRRDRRTARSRACVPSSNCRSRRHARPRRGFPQRSLSSFAIDSSRLHATAALPCTIGRNSQLVIPQQRTGVSAVTVAERGALLISAISPK